MSRVIWVQAHPRRLPERIDTPPHIEMFRAYMQDISKDPKKLEDVLAREIGRELEERA